MMDEMTLTLHHPLTDEEWNDIIDHTPEITFHTKNGKDVVFVKKGLERKKGKWLWVIPAEYGCGCYRCSECNLLMYIENNYCPQCGADMRGEDDG